MKLHFLGANRQVTGSRYLLEACHRQVMVDCGLFQEREYQNRNWATSPVPPNEIDALLLTHAHIDHIGLVPRLVSAGFRGPIYCTQPTVDLAEILLLDSAEIQEEEAAYKRRRHEKEGRRGRYPEEPLYRRADARRCLPQLKGVKYAEVVELGPGLEARFFDAGHILGSASIEFRIGQGDDLKRLLFSGDIGQHDRPLVHDPTHFPAADFVVLESTYGDRQHEDGGDIATQLAEVVNRTAERGGNVVIPTFAVERAQELVYYIAELTRDGRIPRLRVFLDSPMAIDVTDVFRRHQSYFDADAWEIIAAGDTPLRFPGLRMARTSNDSKKINHYEKPAIVMASSGMCTAGRIKHHLRQNIERSESTILFVGYQAHGTLGRQILEGDRRVRIHGRHYEVRAEVSRIDGFSGHADRNGLLSWAGHLQPPPTRCFLTHGDDQAALALANELRRQHRWQAEIPEYGDVVDLRY